MLGLDKNYRILSPRIEFSTQIAYQQLSLRHIADKKLVKKVPLKQFSDFWFERNRCPIFLSSNFLIETLKWFLRVICDFFFVEHVKIRKKKLTNLVR